MTKKAKAFFDKFELHFMVLLMDVFLINVTAQIFMRIVFNTALFFTEEVSRVAFLWMVLLGLSYATLFDCHIRIAFIVEMLPKRAQMIIGISIHLLAIAIFAWVFYIGIQFVRYSATNVTPALRISKAFFVSILPFAASLTIIRSAQKIHRIWSSFRKGGNAP
jgi:TRAP-type C4-dicarboxylate transport system permease small subunit